MDAFIIPALILVVVVGVICAIARFFRAPRWMIFGLPTAPMLIVFVVVVATGAGAAGHGAAPLWPIFGVALIITVIVSALVSLA